ncbi:hypothetical protein [Cucumibacter marinus]|uniref:hypothetical protein n=1 Tax=Cucumibacter marinus TaxID=1121252 RepID=UPI0004198789|nr:hypothetical protein [Cucumibacter marinus]
MSVKITDSELKSIAIKGFVAAPPLGAVIFITLGVLTGVAGETGAQAILLTLAIAYLIAIVPAYAGLIVLRRVAKELGEIDGLSVALVATVLSGVVALAYASLAHASSAIDWWFAGRVALSAGIAVILLWPLRNLVNIGGGQ